MKILAALLLMGAALAVLGAVLVYEGLFEIAADVPHSAIVFKLMETARDRAISVRARDIQVLPLDNPELIAKGARDYSEMCTSCHLAPGDKESELREGLYPKPPDLTLRIQASPAEMFWVIKHGIKMTAMPAWGLTHDDTRIWNIVAFLRKLPELTPEQYQATVGPSEEAQSPGPDDAGTTAPAAKSKDHSHRHHHHHHAHHR